MLDASGYWQAFRAQDVWKWLADQTIAHIGSQAVIPVRPVEYQSTWEVRGLGSRSRMTGLWFTSGALDCTESDGPET